jgi:hypothetical protein
LLLLLQEGLLRWLLLLLRRLWLQGLRLTRLLLRLLLRLPSAAAADLLHHR